MSVGTVKSLSVEAYVIDKDGNKNILKVGDTLNEGEVIRTAMGGGTANI